MLIFLNNQVVRFFSCFSIEVSYLLSLNIEQIIFRGEQNVQS
jgi:hypothetical protein